MLTGTPTLDQVAQGICGFPPLPEMFKVRLDDAVKDVSAHSRGGGLDDL